ncbi:hypothetical protein L209DRAFT_760427 [Thermothelomyces heterothallicus CBS 203.75]
MHKGRVETRRSPTFNPRPERDEIQRTVGGCHVVDLGARRAFQIRQIRSMYEAFMYLVRGSAPVYFIPERFNSRGKIQVRMRFLDRGTGAASFRPVTTFISPEPPCPPLAPAGSGYTTVTVFATLWWICHLGPVPYLNQPTLRERKCKAPIQYIRYLRICATICVHHRVCPGSVSHESQVAVLTKRGFDGTELPLDGVRGCLADHGIIRIFRRPKKGMNALS